MAYDQDLRCISDVQWSARRHDEETHNESLLLCTYHYETLLLNKQIEPGVRLAD